MSGITGIEWLNQNANRAYPIKEDMSRSPLDSVVLPDYVLVDFVLTVAAGTADVRAYLSKVAYVSGLLTLGFADASDVTIGLVTIDIPSHTKNQGYTFAGVGEAYEDAIGRVVVGDLATLADDLPEGLYTFTLGTAELESRTIRPSLRGVRSLQISNLDSVSEYLYGHIKLVAGSNVQLAYSATDNAITVSAVGGANLLNAACPCTTTAAQTNVIRTINGIPIEDVTITGDDQCITVTTDGDKIVISDKCSAPCCDCPELQMLTDSLKILDGTVRNLESYAQQLDERIRTFVNNYVLSKTL
jgi:hypothetical protein